MKKSHFTTEPDLAGDPNLNDSLKKRKSHQRTVLIRTVSEFLILGLLMALCTRAIANPTIREPRLTQDLKDTPRLFTCMRDIFEDQLPDFEVRGFMGPREGVERGTAVYQILESEFRERTLLLVFTATAGNRWRMFTYGGDPSDPHADLKIGMDTREMHSLAQIYEMETEQVIGNLDVNPCARYLSVL